MTKFLPYISRGLGVLATPPPPGGGQLLTSCCAFAACACFQVTSCVLLSVPVYLSCWAWSDFPTGGGAPGLFLSCCIHVYASFSPLQSGHSLHASAYVHCSESAQIRSAHPTPSLCTFDVPCMSTFLICCSVHAVAAVHTYHTPACSAHLPYIKSA
jgi:hypothetical protein